LISDDRLTIHDCLLLTKNVPTNYYYYYFYPMKMD
jgi:hypothetical protein